jgi:hypothetical protein
LEQKCIEGTRAESKYAITAIASLHSSDDKKFARLFEVGGISVALTVCYYISNFLMSAHCTVPSTIVSSLQMPCKNENTYIL